MYVLGPDETVLAQAPLTENNLVGRRYTPPNIQGSEESLKMAMDGIFDPNHFALRTPQRKYWMSVPVMDSAGGNQVVAVYVLTVEPPPPLLISMGPAILGGLITTAVILLVGIVPFGALFGFIMSRGLTRRLAALTAAADAWGEGDFRPLPQDRTRDELGTLGMRMRHMAERIQNLLHTQQELAMVEERNRLARELHDTVKQQIFATLLQVRPLSNNAISQHGFGNFCETGNICAHHVIPLAAIGFRSFECSLVDIVHDHAQLVIHFFTRP